MSYVFTAPFVLASPFLWAGLYAHPRLYFNRSVLGVGASAVGLFKAAGIRPVTGPSASIASCVIFCVCVYGLRQMYQVIFDVVANIVDPNRRKSSEGEKPRATVRAVFCTGPLVPLR